MSKYGVQHEYLGRKFLYAVIGSIDFTFVMLSIVPETRWMPDLFTSIHYYTDKTGRDDVNYWTRFGWLDLLTVIYWSVHMLLFSLGSIDLLFMLEQEDNVKERRRRGPPPSPFSLIDNQALFYFVNRFIFFFIFFCFSLLCFYQAPVSMDKLWTDNRVGQLILCRKILFLALGSYNLTSIVLVIFGSFPRRFTNILDSILRDIGYITALTFSIYYGLTTLMNVSLIIRSLIELIKISNKILLVIYYPEYDMNLDTAASSVPVLIKVLKLVFDISLIALYYNVICEQRYYVILNQGILIMMPCYLPLLIRGLFKLAVNSRQRDNDSDDSEEE